MGPQRDQYAKRSTTGCQGGVEDLERVLVKEERGEKVKGGEGEKREKGEEGKEGGGLPVGDIVDSRLVGKMVVERGQVSQQGQH